MHPLFAKITDDMDTNYVEFAQALDFEVYIQTAPAEAEYTDPKAHAFLLPSWAMECAASLSHDGFAYAGCWENDEGQHALFLSPKTTMARALWWVGVGFSLSQTPPKKQWGYRVAGEQYQGWFDDKEAAKQTANKEALEDKREFYEIALFTMPFASRFIDSDCLFEGMQAQARDEIGDLTDDWLGDIGTPNTSDLNESVDLLVDGFVVDMNDAPAFSNQYSKAETFAVVPIYDASAKPTQTHDIL